MTETTHNLPERPDSGLFNRLLRTIDGALGVSQVVMPRLAALERRQTALNDSLAEAWQRSDSHIARFAQRQNEFTIQLPVFSTKLMALRDDQAAQLEETRAMQAQISAQVVNLEALRVEVEQAETQQQSLNENLSTQFAALDAVLADQKSLVARIQTDVGSANTDREALGGRVDATERTNAELTKALETVQSTLATTKDELAKDFDSLASGLAAERAQREKAVEVTQSDIASIRTEAEKRVSDEVARLSAFDGRLDAHEESLAEWLGEHAKAVESMRADMQMDREAREGLATELSGRIGSIEESVSTQSESVSALGAELAAVGHERKSTLEESQSRFVALEAKIKADGKDRVASVEESRAQFATLEEGFSKQRDELERIDAALDRIDVELKSAATMADVADLDRVSELEALITEQTRAQEALLSQVEMIKSSQTADFSAAVDEIRTFALPENLSSLEAFVDMMSNETGRVNQRLIDFDSEFARIDKRIVEHDEVFDQLANIRLARLTDHIEMLGHRLAGVDALTEVAGASVWPSQAASKRARAPFYVFVCSYGRTATYWLSQLLNAHPDIICSHGPTTPPIIEYEDSSPQELDKWVWENMPAFHDLKLPDVMRDMRKMGDARYYVKVHAYSAFNLFNRLVSEGVSRPVFMANVVRHPVTRVESFAKRWVENAQWNAQMRSFMLDWWREQPPARELEKHLARNFDVDFTNEANVFFATACLWLRQDREDLAVPMLHASSERLVGDPDYFAWFLDRLTEGRLAGDPEIMDIYRKTGPKNVSAGALPAREVFDGWDDWKRAAFAYVTDVYDLAPLYARFPYSLDFGS